MDMMAENPLEAAETLAELFAHDNEVKHFKEILSSKYYILTMTSAIFRLMHE